jgi:hypothetical protein
MYKRKRNSMIRNQELERIDDWDGYDGGESGEQGRVNALYDDLNYDDGELLDSFYDEEEEDHDRSHSNTNKSFNAGPLDPYTGQRPVFPEMLELDQAGLDDFDPIARDAVEYLRSVR